jgi:hypothetical protein
VLAKSESAASASNSSHGGLRLARTIIRMTIELEVVITSLCPVVFLTVALADLVLNFWNLRNHDLTRVWGVHHTSVHPVDVAGVATAPSSGWWWSHEVMGLGAAAAALVARPPGPRAPTILQPNGGRTGQAGTTAASATVVNLSPSGDPTAASGFPSGFESEPLSGRGRGGGGGGVDSDPDRLEVGPGFTLQDRRALAAALGTQDMIIGGYSDIVYVGGRVTCVTVGLRALSAVCAR